MTVCQTSPAIQLGFAPRILQTLAQPGTELAIWQRQTTPDWMAWLGSLPAHTLPTGRMVVTTLEATTALHAVCDASGTPSGLMRDAFLADVAQWVTLFADLGQQDRVRLRLDGVTNNACCRWHRDSVPLRLVCTYRGPGTLWVPPDVSDDVLAHADDEAPQANALQTGDVALYKGCGWPGHTHQGGIVHRSPRIMGLDITRLVLVLDQPNNPCRG